MSYELQTDANDLIQSHFTVFIRRTFVSCLMSCDILDAFVHREKMVCQMAEMGQSLHFCDVRVVSAFHPIATKSRTSRHFGFGPEQL